MVLLILRFRLVLCGFAFSITNGRDADEFLEGGAEVVLGFVTGEFRDIGDAPGRRIERTARLCRCGIESATSRKSCRLLLEHAA